MCATKQLQDANRAQHPSYWLLVLLLGAGSLFACFPLRTREWPPPIPQEDVPGLTLLTPGENASFQNPTWSPDGSTLAFDLATPLIGATRDTFPADAEIYILDLETLSRQQLTDNNFADVRPDWSPDGDQIVFVRSAANSGDPPAILLMVLSADSSSEEILLECPSLCLDPRWSPDGELVAFGMEDGIWTIRRDGSDLRQASGRKSAAASIPAWSPDGQRLVYWASQEATSASQSTGGDLAVLDLSTGEETIVFSGGSPLDPDWSPVDSLILFSNQAPQQEGWTLFTLDLETGVARRLIPADLGFNNLFDAVWSPDRTRIAFAYGFRDTASHLYILDLAKLEALTSEPTAGP